MKKKAVPVLAALGMILIVTAGFFGARFLERYIPSKEQADMTELLGVQGDEVALYLNEDLQEAKGLFLEGQTYLPIQWVNDMLNQRFYWDSNEKLLVYALPDSIVYADHSTMGSSGKPLIWVNENGVYLSMGLVANYTDIRITAFDSAEYKRVFINNNWDAQKKAVVSQKGNVRVKGGVKSPIVTWISPGSQLTVLESMEKWDKVRTQDGFVGYVERKRLGEVTSEVPVSTFVKPVYTSISMEEPVILAWHQMTNPEGNASFDSLIANTKGVNVISPTWFELTDNEGNFRSLAQEDYVKKAHDKGLKVWALINNFSPDVNTEILMSKTSTRRKLIDALMAEVERYSLDGINLDFEGIKEEAGVHYIQFIRELSIPCRKKGIVLSVDNYVPAPGNQFYNRKEQGIVADYVIVMGYDEHYAGGEAGSVASIRYVENGIKDTLAQVPKEKVINGIPLYTRVWIQGADGKTNSSSMGIARAKEWVSQNKVELYWQDDLGQYYGELQTEEGLKQLWLEEERSIGLKMDLIRQYGLAGVACWKLGFEPADLWDKIRLDKN
ncbi:glycosyl hydrolase family 18 protein [Lacrimispora saccharolytica]|uniref:Glycoside hydrolase family 18 n=1 Tax=Lacrimispora saccharolytica (strain ATCC 35040 / DSM 2544 / NRCC 2533 / WM1) TaxID=610130 RepID=D9R2Y0_LACSW|nr:glycosyl hydrolase family 18 protein [Lacrimispora saccharolytica]ADL02970.1 glycoside hydrolase family 18 [[Clostridium] saccharolyticum WM1]QRV18839.1 SH3 domain-containing protein [Lacrimispora saccharolytica]